MACSVTRWLEYFSIFGHLKECKFSQKHKIFAKVGSKFCQIVNTAFKSYPNTLKLCQSGKISPSLVTLLMNHPCVVAGFYDDIWMGPQILAHHLLLMLTVDLWESSKAAVSRDVHDCKNFIAAANGVKHGSYIFCNGPSQPLLFIFFLFKHKFCREKLLASAGFDLRLSE